MSFFPPTTCVQCDAEGAIARYSLGVYYSRLCDRCWNASNVRKEGPEAFDLLDAGESLEAEDGEEWP